jgi:hypothetical protein
MKISWVMTTRNDGFGGEIDGVENQTMKRLQVTVNSIMRLPCESEIIVVEFCPDGVRPGVASFLEGLPVKVITVKKELLVLLQAESGQKMSFYEALAKDIGIKQATGDYVIACNPDNVFPTINFDEVMKDLESGFVVRAVRLETPNDVLKYDIQDILDIGEEFDLDVTNRYSTAAGDFTGFKRDIYAKVGGYGLMHGDWHMDNLLLEMALVNGYKISVPYSHFHLAHVGAVTAEGKNKDWRTFKPISKKLLEKVNDYVLA